MAKKYSLRATLGQTPISLKGFPHILFYFNHEYAVPLSLTLFNLDKWPT